MKTNTTLPTQKNPIVTPDKHTGYCQVVNGVAIERFTHYQTASAKCPANGIIVAYADLKKHGYKEGE